MKMDFFSRKDDEFYNSFVFILLNTIIDKKIEKYKFVQKTLNFTILHFIQAWLCLVRVTIHVKTHQVIIYLKTPLCAIIFHTYAMHFSLIRNVNDSF